MIIKNGNVYTKDFVFENKNIKIKDNVITDISCEMFDETGEEVIDGIGKMIIPGLIDIHFHGCMGYDFCDASDEAITAIAKYQKQNGVTGICPATMTLSIDRLKNICKVAAKHVAGKDESELVGINLEGPFISKIKCGAQNPDFVSTATPKDINEIIEQSNGLAKLITVAPEQEGVLECIDKLHDKINFSIGHTTSDYETAYRAYQLGAKHVTHLFNAMPGFTHREPGVIGAAALFDEVMVELICDGIHVHPAAIKAAFRLFTSERMVLVSDSSRACGMPDGEYELGGQKVYLHDNACWLNEDTLAASAANVFQCMKNVINFGIPKEDAIRAATYNPAKAIGILDECGSIEVGKKANFVILNDNFEIERVI